MASKEDFQNFLTKHVKSVDIAEKELAELRQKEHGMQCVKESLLLKRKQLESDIEKRNKKLDDARKRSQDAPSKKVFDDVFKLVDSCYHHQLLLLELEEQLTVAKTVREEQDYINLIQGLTESDDHTGTLDESSILHCWYQQMKQYAENSECHNDLADAKYFYNMKLSSERSTNTSGATSTLSFTTRHKGYCLCLNIKETRSPVLQTLTTTSTPDYCITSDICLAGLQHQGEQYLRSGKSALDFITNVVCPLLEELCV